MLRNFIFVRLNVSSSKTRNTNSILNKIECCLFYPNIIFKMTKDHTEVQNVTCNYWSQLKRSSVLQNTSMYPEDTNKEANILILIMILIAWITIGNLCRTSLTRKEAGNAGQNEEMYSQAIFAGSSLHMRHHRGKWV